MYVPIEQGHNPLNRAEAIALLKETVTLNLIQPSFVSVDKNKEGTFNVVMKVDGDLTQIRAFLPDKDLILSEDKEKGTVTIFKR
jgi:hypothetical protein